MDSRKFTQEEARALLLQGEDFYNVVLGVAVMPDMVYPDDPALYAAATGGVETPDGGVLSGIVTAGPVDEDAARGLDRPVGDYCREAFPAPGTTAPDRMDFDPASRLDDFAESIAEFDGWCLADPEHVAEAFAELDAKKRALERENGELERRIAELERDCRDARDRIAFLRGRIAELGAKRECGRKAFVEGRMADAASRTRTKSRKRTPSHPAHGNGSQT